MSAIAMSGYGMAVCSPVGVFSRNVGIEIMRSEIAMAGDVGAERGADMPCLPQNGGCLSKNSSRIRTTHTMNDRQRHRNLNTRTTLLDTFIERTPQQRERPNAVSPKDLLLSGFEMPRFSSDVRKRWIYKGIVEVSEPDNLCDAMTRIAA